MGTGYTRNDTGNNIADGNVIDAADLDGEFDSLQAAFNSSTGHTHDGTAAEGAPITVVGPAQEYVATNTELRPKSDNTYDLGSASLQWKDLYVNGVANLDSVDIDAGTIDGTVVGGTTPAAGSFTTLSATGNITVGGTVDGRDLATDGTKLDGIEAGADVTSTTNVTAAGALMDSELTNITAVKALDQGVATTDSPTFAGVTLATADINGGTLDGVVIGATTPAAVTGTTAAFNSVSIGGSTITATVAELNVLDGITATTAELNILDGVTATATELNYVDGVTSNVQTQLNAKALSSTTVSAGSGLVGGGDLSTNRTITHADTSSQASVNNSGTTVIQDVTLDGFGHVTALGSVALGLADFGVTASAAELNITDGLTASTAELNTLDGITATTVELNKLGGVTWTLIDYNTLTSTAAELNLLDGVTWTLTDYNTLTATAAELNQLDGVTLGNAVTLDEVTTAQWRSNTAAKLLSTDQVWGAMAEVTLTDGANISLDLSTGFDFTVTLAGNRTLDNPTNAKVGQRGRIRVVQDGTGSRTLSFGTSYEFFGGAAPTLTTTAAAEDVLYYDVISPTRILVTVIKDIS